MRAFLASFLKARRTILLLAQGALLLTAICPAQSATVIHLDASQPWAEPVAARYDLQFNAGPSGVAGLNSRVLLRDGKPWLPVMGEFHFSRVPRAQWEEELLKMKAAGVNIVATYVIWIHHEEIEGQFDWSGQRDLRAFAELCAKHGLLLEPRIGPWAHAEARNGGLPDWVLKQGLTRQNDPKYLASVSRFYDEIGHQLQGLMWQDGGPVIAVQIENEYAKRGAGAGAEHILTLKKMAIESGLRVPYYFVTGWDHAVVPERAVIPVYGGGYPDAPWDGSIEKLPPAEVYAFRFHSRVAVNMGAIGAKDGPHADNSASQPLPYLTAEIGGGIEDTYHRRPVIQPDDIGAMFPVMLGSGVNLYGTYMFQGGQNPNGQRTTLQESQATGYPNDLPIKGYDFQAPLGEYGQERASLGRMKLYQYFLNSFGGDLAPMVVHAPAEQPASTADFSVPRAAVRTRDDQGFLFFNNYVRNYPQPAWPQMQFEVKLPSGLLRIPAKPVDLPSGAYFIWPIHQPVGGVDLVYSTAQPFTRLNDRAEYVFAAVRGVAPEFAFKAADVAAIHATSGTVETEAGVRFVRGMLAGAGAAIDLTAKNGQHTRILLLTADEAEQAWKVRTEGRERLLVSAQDVVVGEDGNVRLHALGGPRFAFALLPAPAHTPAASLPLLSAGDGGYTVTAAERRPTLQVTALKAAGIAAPVPLAPPPSWRAHGVAQAPEAGDLPQAAEWGISLPKNALDGLSDLFLQIRYQGDVARLDRKGHLLDDDFFNGLDWQIGLKRYAAAGMLDGLRLSILPLRQDAPVYFETPRPIAYDGKGQAVALQGIELVPEYELQLNAAGR
ncbi:beta-galactosidase [Telmatobacter bradus]|uniref:beta-galactosidase n=1 Tax=Telmatobacter bradus TaxID=474953 RepID=UPI003B42C143